jgi:hypothetical protein
LQLLASLLWAAHQAGHPFSKTSTFLTSRSYRFERCGAAVSCAVPVLRFSRRLLVVMPFGVQDVAHLTVHTEGSVVYSLLGVKLLYFALGTAPEDGNFSCTVIVTLHLKLRSDGGREYHNVTMLGVCGLLVELGWFSDHRLVLQHDAVSRPRSDR